MSIVNIPKREKIRVNILSHTMEAVHFHRDFELLFVLKGSLELNINSNIYKLSRGEFFIINSNIPHSIKSCEDLTFMKVLINYELIRDIVGDEYFYFKNDLSENSETAKKDLKLAVNQLLHYYLDKKSEQIVDFAYLSICYRILDILSTYYLEYNRNSETGSYNSHDYAIRVKEINDYLNLNYNQSITLQSLADHLFLTPSYLSKYFKRTYGMNFKKYLTSVRLLHALDDVLYTGRSLTSIAYDYGFPNVTAFGKCFYDFYKITPQEARNKNVNQSESLYISEEKQKVIEEYLIKNHDFLDDTVYIEKSVLVVDKISRNYQNMINIGPAEEILNSEMQKHLLLMKNRLGMTYVRFWNIFTEELLIKAGESKGSLNFTKLNYIFDFLVKNDLKPHIELTDKPKIISRTASQSIRISQDNEASITQFKNMLEAFLKHYINRYGLSVVENWRFELWLNEWRLEYSYTFDNYFEKYSVAYDVCKKYSSLIKVGGCGYNSQYSSHLDLNFWMNWTKLGKVPDFVSLTSYAYTRIGGKDEYSSIRSKDNNILQTGIDELNHILNTIGWLKVPIYVSEWNLSFSDRNYINDSCFKGCYILENVFNNLDSVLSYHYLSDQLSEYYDSSNILYGGLGLITKESIFKPAAHAYEFLSKMDDYYFAKSLDYIMTSDKNDNYTIICHNKQELTDLYYSTEEDKIDINNIDSYFEQKRKKYHFVLKDVKSGVYKIKIKSISYDKGSLLSEWKKLGFYKNLSLNDIEYVKGSSIPELKIKEVEAKNNTLNLDLNLSSNEFVMIKIKRK